MRPTRVLLFALLVTAAPLAGCFGSEVIPNERAASASGGRASPGWAYDGAGVVDAGATLTASFLNDQNTGEVIATFQYAGSTWDVVFDQFAQAPGKDFQDGGIAFDLVEHGDTGVADASIPRILALVAAWGTASVKRDGEAVTGAAGERWSAHLMVSDTTVRNAEGKILKGDGASPYSPDAPGDATRVEGDRQALLKLVHPDGETAARAPVPFRVGADFAGPQSTQALAVPAEKGAQALTITLNATASAVPLAAGELSARVVDAEGNEVAPAQAARVLPNQPVSLTFDVPAELIKGPLSVQVTGTGAFRAEATGTVAFADVPLIVLTWDDVTVT